MGAYPRMAVNDANRVGTGVTNAEDLPGDQNSSHDEVGTDDSTGEDDAAGAHK